MHSLLLLLSCVKPAALEETVAALPPEPPPLPAYATAMLSALDPKADACTDFYRYACGGWIDATPLPADKPLWVRSFSVIREQNAKVGRDLVEAAAKDPAAKDADWARVGKFYGSCMDEAAVDAAGATALVPTLAEIDALRDLKAVWAYSGKLQRQGVGVWISQWVDGDFADPTKQILHLSEGGLALPDRDYYLPAADDAKGRALLVAYEAHVAEILGLAGVPDAATAARHVVAVETAIATAWVPRDQLRDPEKIYNKLDRAGLVKKTPKLDWPGYLAALGGRDIVDINVEAPDVYVRMEAALKKTDVKALRAYLKWQLVHSMAPHLSAPIYASHFSFFGQKVTGQREPEPRWKRCVAANDAALGEITGRYYVDKQFAGDSKQVATSMIGGVEQAFAGGLPGLTWMDDPTRARALEKMKQVRNKIGYPDAWRDYSKLEIAGDYARNVLAARAFESDRTIAQVGKPIDPIEWYMTPQAVNAYYTPTRNEIVFPAGILQAPFFDASYPAALNYGAIGVIMGHELTHGFDDQGAKFDGSGRMVEWWAPEASTRFEERTACVVKQFDAYEIQPGLKVNGTLTLGENIADLGGTREAYRAYKASGSPSVTVGNLTDDQLFFVSFAQSWCAVASPEVEKMRALSDPHSPPRYRVNGAVTNLPEFWSAFGCAEGTPMHPKNACEVW